MTRITHNLNIFLTSRKKRLCSWAKKSTLGCLPLQWELLIKGVKIGKWIRVVLGLLVKWPRDAALCCCDVSEAPEKSFTLLQISSRAVIKSRFKGSSVLSELLVKWTHCFNVILKKDLMGKWWMSESHKGHIYRHIVGYYVRVTVVICTIGSNGVKVSIFCHLKIEILFIPALFNRELCGEFPLH